MFAPAGTYHINVWPPYNSNYVNFDETSFTVNSAVTKNITLNTGYKVYGYVTDSQGTPMVGAIVFLNGYSSGWFTNNVGYYFLSVPAGTYTIDAHPRVGSYSGSTSSFTIYYEYNFAVNVDTYKNITVTAPTTMPTPNPTNQPNPNPTQPPSPTTTPEPPLPSTQMSIDTDASSYQVGSTITVKGVLTDQNGNPLNDKTVVLSYSIGDRGSWFDIGSGKTNPSGQYSIQWLIDASGTFNLKAEYSGEASYCGSKDCITLSFLPYQGKQVFFVESNSTITGLNFNSGTLELGFVVSGETGTEGYTTVTVADSLVANFTGFTVSLDGK